MTFIKTINLKAFAAFIIINFTAAFILLTCFSPYGADMGSLTISIGDSSRAIWQGNEYLDFEHEVILIGPGGTRSQTFTGTGTARFSNLASGTYSINVRAVGDTPAVYNQPNPTTAPNPNFPSRMLRAYGIDTVDIRSGQTNNAHISMLPATEVTNEAQFYQALYLANDPRGEYIVIKDDIELTDTINISSTNLPSTNKITLIAEETVSITTVPGTTVSIFNILNNELVLGAPGMRGNLVLDGNNSINYVIEVSVGAQFTMHDRVTLKSSSTAVDVGGTFNMLGGVISNNLIGVSILNDGIFTMEGGRITDNKNTAEGGGVYVSYGTFTMRGGTISGNFADGYGGGVYVFETGIFTKTGGTIYGNNEGANSNHATNGGHAVYVEQVDDGSSPPSISRYARVRNTTAGPSVNLNSEATNW